jgi:hypothetical protein
MKNSNILGLVASMTLACSSLANSDSAAVKLASRHVQISSQTLVPVTEATIWSSNCGPAKEPAIVRVLHLVSQSHMTLIQPKAFSAQHIRAVIYDPPRMIYVDAGMTIKIIEHSQTWYLSPSHQGGLEAALKEAFDNCHRSE